MKKLWQLCGIAAFWLAWPALWVYLHNTTRTRVIITAGDKVLLLKGWLGAGQWILPGGGAHSQEDPRQAAIREVQEETGLVLEAAQLQPAGEILAKEYGFSFKCHVYKLALPEIMPLNPRFLEVTEVAWLDKTAPPDISPLTRQLLAL